MSDAIRTKWAHETLNFFNRKSYWCPTTGEIIFLEHVKNVGSYVPESLTSQMMLGYKSECNYDTNIKVQNIGAIEAADELTKYGKTAILNFASAIKPGGGFLSGKQAQEEALARSSNLLYSLIQAPDYYSKNIEQGTPFYTHDMIYSYDVTFIRKSNGHMMGKPFCADVITSPAVNLGEAIEQKVWKKYTWMYDINEYTYSVMEDRIRRVLTLAAVNNVENLVLGAWGCGIFKCDPNKIAKLFAQHLIHGDFYNVFKNVTFAVLDNDKEVLVKCFKINIEDEWNKQKQLFERLDREYKD